MPSNSAGRKLGSRLHQIREEVFGPDGLPELEQLSGIPARTWENYESGVTIPGVSLLKFIDLTSAAPAWLLHGRGPRFLDCPSLHLMDDILADRMPKPLN